MKPTQTQLAEAYRDSLAPGPIAYKPSVQTFMLHDLALATYGPRATGRIERRGVGLFCDALLKETT